MKFSCFFRDLPCQSEKTAADSEEPTAVCMLLSHRERRNQLSDIAEDHDNILTVQTAVAVAFGVCLALKGNIGGRVLCDHTAQQNDIADVHSTAAIDIAAEGCRDLCRLIGNQREVVNVEIVRRCNEFQYVIACADGELHSGTGAPLLPAACDGRAEAADQIAVEVDVHVADQRLRGVGDIQRILCCLRYIDMVGEPVASFNVADILRAVDAVFQFNAALCVVVLGLNDIFLDRLEL